MMKKPQDGNIVSASATHGGYVKQNQWTLYRLNMLSICHRH